jgi:predicted phage terminase large subunit-like protein
MQLAKDATETPAPIVPDFTRYARLNKRPRCPINNVAKMPWSDGVMVTELDIIRAEHAEGRPGMRLAQFVSGAWHLLEPSTPLEWNWHLDAVCDHLEALILNMPGPCKRCKAKPENWGWAYVPPSAQLEASGMDENGELPTEPAQPIVPTLCQLCGGETEKCPQNLLINVPPGTMKSLIFSVFLPAWVWLFRPSWRAIYASGTPSVVTRDSLKCRNLIKSDWYQKTFQPSWKIRSDQDEKQHFANTANGFRMGVGAGGSITGERAHFLGVDDPNDAKEIHSKAHRDSINERWWDSAFHNRIADPTLSKRGIIMQRLHEEDLAGHVLEKEKGEWANLVIQMEYEKERPGDQPTWLHWMDPRNEEGEILARRFTPAFLKGERLTLGPSGYAGQMQQRPVGAAGNKFQREWWRFWCRDGKQHERPKHSTMVPPRVLLLTQDFDEVIVSVDAAFKDNPENDYVVILVVGRIGADKYILDRKREHLSFTATKQALRQTRADWPRAYKIVIEDKANGTAIIDDLKSEISGIVPYSPGSGDSKEARAAVAEPQVAAGNIYLPEGAPWLQEWVDEFAAFPKGRKDDQVDALSQAVIAFQDPEMHTTRMLLGIA